MKFWRSQRVKLAVVAVLLAVACVSIGVIVKDKQSERQNLQKQQELEALWNSSQQAEPEEMSSQSAKKEYANPTFEELLTINKDLVGWLEVGELSAPVVQTVNNDYYLTHDFYGKEDPHGTVYADTRNNVVQGDDNTVLYGHNYKKSKQIFYEVEKYRSPEYAMAHPVFSFTTLEEKRDYLVLGLFFTNTEPAQGDVFDYHNKLSFATNAEMETFIAEARSRSLIMSDVEADGFDQLITLSTCGYDFEGQRIVLLGRRLRPNEDAAQFVSTRYYSNPAPLMPEIWTKLYGKK